MQFADADDYSASSSTDLPRSCSPDGFEWYLRQASATGPLTTTAKHVVPYGKEYPHLAADMKPGILSLNQEAYQRCEQVDAETRMLSMAESVRYQQPSLLTSTGITTSSNSTSGSHYDFAAQFASRTPSGNTALGTASSQAHLMELTTLPPSLVEANGRHSPHSVNEIQFRSERYSLVREPPHQTQPMYAYPNESELEGASSKIAGVYSYPPGEQELPTPSFPCISPAIPWYFPPFPTPAAAVAASPSHIPQTSTYLQQPTKTEHPVATVSIDFIRRHCAEPAVPQSSGQDIRPVNSMDQCDDPHGFVSWYRSLNLETVNLLSSTAILRPASSASSGFSSPRKRKHSGITTIKSESEGAAPHRSARTNILSIEKRLRKSVREKARRIEKRAEDKRIREENAFLKEQNAFLKEENARLRCLLVRRPELSGIPKAAQASLPTSSPTRQRFSVDLGLFF